MITTLEVLPFNNAVPAPLSHERLLALQDVCPWPIKARPVTKKAVDKRTKKFILHRVNQTITNIFKAFLKSIAPHSASEPLLIRSQLCSLPPYFDKPELTLMT
jgi:hypothetical protein